MVIKQTEKSVSLKFKWRKKKAEFSRADSGFYSNHKSHLMPLGLCLVSDTLKTDRNTERGCGEQH